MASGASKALGASSCTTVTGWVTGNSTGCCCVGGSRFCGNTLSAGAWQTSLSGVDGGVVSCDTGHTITWRGTADVAWACACHSACSVGCLKGRVGTFSQSGCTSCACTGRERQSIACVTLVTLCGVSILTVETTNYRRRTSCREHGGGDSQKQEHEDTDLHLDYNSDLRLLINGSTLLSAYFVN